MSRYIKKSSFPIALVALAVVAIFTFRGEAQQPRNPNTGAAPQDQPISATAVAFAESDAVRDMPDANTLIDLGDDRGDGEEKNPDNVALGDFRRALVASKPQTKTIPPFDAAIKGSNAAISPNLPGAPLISFDGLVANEGFITLNGTTVAPSVENLAVGPRDIVQATNVGFKIWDKTGTPRTNAKAIRSLFSKLGGVCANFERRGVVLA